MGYYINPEKCSKEEYLKEKGELIKEPATWGSIPKDKVAVCIVFMEKHTAAIIAYSEREFEFVRKPDKRKKDWYLLSIEDAIRASDWNGK